MKPLSLWSLWCHLRPALQMSIEFCIFVSCSKKMRWFSQYIMMVVMSLLSQPESSRANHCSLLIIRLDWIHLKSFLFVKADPFGSCKVFYKWLWSPNVSNPMVYFLTIWELGVLCVWITSLKGTIKRAVEPFESQHRRPVQSPSVLFLRSGDG